jgi:hypothetical protein
LILQQNILAYKMLTYLTDGRNNGMKWLETIKLQSASGMEGIAERQLLGLAKEVRSGHASRGLVEVIAYNHASVTGYFAISLLWSSVPPLAQGSPLGTRITRTLKTFGLVDQSVWIEKA